MRARRCRAIDTRTHIRPSKRARARVWLPPNAHGAADVRGRVRIWASVHASMHERRYRNTRTDGHTTPARAHARKRSRRHGFYICTRTYTYGLTHTHIYVSRGRARARRSRPVLTRTYAHTHELLICTHTYAYEPTHAHITVHGDTHLGVARVRAASPTRARRDTLGWILQVNTNAYPCTHPHVYR